MIWKRSLEFEKEPGSTDESREMCSSFHVASLNREVFQVPRSLRGLMFAGCVLFLFFGFGSGVLFLEHTTKARDYLLALTCCIFTAAGVFCFRLARRLEYRIELDPRGISSVSYKGGSEFISWSDIREIKADDVKQRLVVVGPTRDLCIALDYQIENFGRLRHLILAHTLHLRNEGFRFGQKFYRTWINKSILLALSVPLLVLAIATARQRPSASVFLVLLPAYLLTNVIACDPVSVEILHGGIAVHYVCRKLIVPFSSISAISLIDTVDRGNVWATVRIERVRQRPLNLYRFREGSLKLHAALRSAWQSSQV